MRLVREMARPGGGWRGPYHNIHPRLSPHYINIFHTITSHYNDDSPQGVRRGLQSRLRQASHLNSLSAFSCSLSCTEGRGTGGLKRRIL